MAVSRDIADIYHGASPSQKPLGNLTGIPPSTLSPPCASGRPHTARRQETVTSVPRVDSGAPKRPRTATGRPIMSTDLADILVPLQCRETIGADGLVAVDSSGGKDSQAMTILLSCIVPWEQRLVVHAPLGEVESPDTIKHIESTLPNDVPLILAPVTSGKSLLDSIKHGAASPPHRFAGVRTRSSADPSSESCAAISKPIPIRRAAGERHGHARGRECGACEEAAWKRSDRNFPSRAILVRLASDLWADRGPGLRRHPDAGQSPHSAYGMGMSRLSCVFCIMASRADLRTAARLQPALYRRYVRLEVRIGHALSPSGRPCRP